jgi:hypothetical protein
MRTSFLAAAVSWIASIAACAADAAAVGVSCGVIAALLTCLWLAHISAFAWRVAASAGSGSRDGGQRREVSSPARREFVPLFVRTVALAAIMSSLPDTISSALGKNQGPCDGCSRYKGSQTCWTCCNCQNSNCIAGCKTSSGGDPDKYNTCLGNCTTTYQNCQKSCQ